MVLNTNRNYDVVNGENIPIRVSFTTSTTRQMCHHYSVNPEMYVFNLHEMYLHGQCKCTYMHNGVLLLRGLLGVIYQTKPSLTTSWAGDGLSLTEAVQWNSESIYNCIHNYGFLCFLWKTIAKKEYRWCGSLRITQAHSSFIKLSP